MAQVPVAEGILSIPTRDSGEHPHLVGSRCTACGIVTFPAQDGCPRCASTAMEGHRLARTGRLWAWTTQDFPPPAPPYLGATGRDFTPFGIGYIELGDLKVESRLTTTDPDVLHAGLEMELVLVPFRTDDDGNEVVTFAFAPVEGA